jgi:hypothetical protein
MGTSAHAGILITDQEEIMGMHPYDPLGQSFQLDAAMGDK